jgi:hypothetical protein
MYLLTSVEGAYVDGSYMMAAFIVTDFSMSQLNSSFLYTMSTVYTLIVRCARLKGLVIFVLLRTKVSWDRTRFISVPARTRQECFSVISYYADCFFPRRTQKSHQHVVVEISSLVFLIDGNYVSHEHVGTEIKRSKRVRGYY